MTSAAANLQADLASGSNYRSNQRCGYCSLHTSNNSCARIRRRSPLRSLQLATFRCRGHTWRIPDRCGRRKNLCRRYLSTQTSAACSCVPPAVRRTYCTLRSTTCRCYVAVLVLAICCQPTEHVVADPVVAYTIVSPKPRLYSFHERLKPATWMCCWINKGVQLPIHNIL